MNHRSLKTRSIWVCLATLAIGLAVPVTTAAAAEPQLGYSANAYGTYAFVGGTVTAGRSAVSGLGCRAQPPAHAENTIGSVSGPPIFSTGAIDTSADAMRLNGVTASRAISTAHDLNLLAGLVTASEVKGVSRVAWNGSEFILGTPGSGFVNLSVAGTAIASAAPNTRVELSGIGYIILNEQIRKVRATSASLTVNMIHVVVTEAGNPLGIPSGSESIVSHAFSSTRFQVGTLGGTAYGTTAQVGDTFTSGPSARISLGCLGTNGNLKSNNVTGITLPPAFTVGNVVTTAQGTVTAASAVGELTSTVEAANLLAGVVTADNVKAVAHAAKNGTSLSFSDEGSGFGNLSVQGSAEVGDDVAPNTKVELAGIGDLWLHRVIKRSRSIEVRMLELIVNQSNTFGIPVGTVVRVAVAKASVR